MIDNSFIGKAEMYDQNLEGSARTYARKAYMQGPYGMEPAVAVFRDRALLTLLTPGDAMRTATQIADALQEHNRQAKR
ncbi:hypothetical protein QFZ60_000479 [Arthrobacter sp. B2I5]|uniref:hypothetical protein n=1 Tax=Arthrobacter sp. B2I5 TaxID=3042266 RepID=UPI002782B2BB|nr:hypothetical protein [Arthrobacter sp. B2I5]MDQ0824306.1 hypothetical protein [Arthrobacter sp. B2I5]